MEESDEDQLMDDYVLSLGTHIEQPTDISHFELESFRQGWIDEIKLKKETKVFDLIKQDPLLQIAQQSNHLIFVSRDLREHFSRGTLFTMDYEYGLFFAQLKKRDESSSNVKLKLRKMKSKTIEIKESVDGINLTEFPTELLILILRHVISLHHDVVSLKAFASTCRRFYNIGQDPSIWKVLCRRTFGAEVTLGEFSSWKELYLSRPFVRFDGIYLTVIPLFSNEDVETSQTCCRLMKFFKDGKVIFYISSGSLTDVIREFSSENFTEDSLFVGQYKCIQNENSKEKTAQVSCVLKEQKIKELVTEEEKAEHPIRARHFKCVKDYSNKSKNGERITTGVVFKLELELQSSFHGLFDELKWTDCKTYNEKSRVLYDRGIFVDTAIDCRFNSWTRYHRSPLNFYSIQSLGGCTEGLF